MILPRPSRTAHGSRRGVAVAALALVLLLSGALAPSSATAQTRNGPGPAAADLFAPVVEGQRDAVYDGTAGSLTGYAIDARFTPASEDALGTVSGRLDLAYVNDTGEPQSSLYLRLYPNADEYGDGEMTLDRVVAGNNTLEVALEEADTLARVELPEPAAPDTLLALSIDFTSSIPVDPERSYGMFSFDRESGTYALAHWLPLLAGYDPVDGWVIGPLSEYGDPVFSNAGLFDVTITAPANLVLVTTGNEVETAPAGDGMLRRRFVSGPVRDFVMVADDDYLLESRRVGETIVNSYFNPEDRAGGLETLTYGAQSLEVFNRLLTPYPYAEMDLVQVEIGNGAAGVEFPQIMFIGSNLYARDDAAAPGAPLEFTVAHEVAHQWWYGTVGNNQYRHAFIDEGVSNDLTTVYLAEQYSPEVAEEQINRNLKLPYFRALFDDQDAVVDQPTDDFPSQASYGRTVYGKAALGFGALRAEIGDEAFFGALKDYSLAFRFEVATPADLRAAFEQRAGRDLGEFWRHWFEAAEGRQDYDAADLAALIRDLGL